MLWNPPTADDKPSIAPSTAALGPSAMTLVTVLAPSITIEA
eukprot:CAMPEP_0174740902 /NCGR_PEP_ID=MMETSP1094-20130205/74789_1 /TAXON_ID=156173 /ORGANISM="Chrysochromulina brevifilum, Strain UTEX LB 985" /LENGTH=40 /DNA_ID= /DNA_START= /DNA_END= /DNA_ORIENTATION=